jgi:hypothetical protein
MLCTTRAATARGAASGAPSYRDMSCRGKAGRGRGKGLAPPVGLLGDWDVGGAERARCPGGDGGGGGEREQRTTRSRVHLERNCLSLLGCSSWDRSLSLLPVASCETQLHRDYSQPRATVATVYYLSYCARYHLGGPLLGGSCRAVRKVGL